MPARIQPLRHLYMPFSASAGLVAAIRGLPGSVNKLHQLLPGSPNRITLKLSLYMTRAIVLCLTVLYKLAADAIEDCFAYMPGWIYYISWQLSWATTWCTMV